MSGWSAVCASRNPCAVRSSQFASPRTSHACAHVHFKKICDPHAHCNVLQFVFELSIDADCLSVYSALLVFLSRPAIVKSAQWQQQNKSKFTELYFQARPLVGGFTRHEAKLVSLCDAMLAILESENCSKQMRLNCCDVGVHSTPF